MSEETKIEELQRRFPGMMVTRLKFIYYQLNSELETTLKFLNDTFIQYKENKTIQESSKVHKIRKGDQGRNRILNPYFAGDCEDLQELTGKELEKEYCKMRQDLFNHQTLAVVTRRVRAKTGRTAGVS